ncbi:MAG: hypothetical protein CL696_00110 [Chloroflexi bacterium]|jgi:hypothetical protein|nr:hypothetical protein [Chloroflexota bacterium]MQG55680.1 hypothetical protein [SAR202 cluster bacterium]|tara:strand:- start:157 stop:813 length:657 start_codon:yes stop_codon:yes gene_type:complete
MGNISEFKLGGICLAVGPAMATALFIIFFLILGDSNIDITDFSAVSSDVSSAPVIEQLLLFLPPIGLIMAYYGLTVIQGTIGKGENGEALFKLGMLMFGINVIASVIGLGGMWQAQAWVGASGTNIAAIAQGISLYSGMIGAIGIVLISLAISTRDEFNNLFAYIIALVFLVVVILSIIGMTNFTEDTWKIVNALFGISYIIISLWSIYLGLNMWKRA